MDRCQNRIGIDATLLARHHYTGIENYTYNIIKAILKTNKMKPYLFFSKEIPPSLKRYSKLFDCKISRFGNRIINDQIWLPISVKKCNVKLLHCPAFPSPIANICKTVLTIHDAVQWKHPETLSIGGRLYYKPLFPQAIKKARRIICVSKSTENDIVNIFPNVREKVTVVYEACDSRINSSTSFTDMQLPKIICKKPYLLSIGSIEPRKNMETLIKAFEIVDKYRPNEINLIIVGRFAWQKVIRIPENLKHKVYFTGYIDSTETLSALYKKAILCVLPSIYEGFGLPLLEAMQSGTAILCSEIPAFKEIAGDAACYADWRSPDSFADKIILLMDNHEYRKQFSEKGLVRVKNFKWKKAAIQTLKIYQEVLNEK